VFSQPKSDVDDAALLRAAAAGDRAAFDRFVSVHRTAVWRFARGLVRDDSLAEDVLQETFLAAYRHAGTFRGDSSTRTWLLTIARRNAYRLGRRADEHAPSSEPTLARLGALAGWGDESPESLVVQQDCRQRLQRALQALPDHEREVIMLRDVEGLSGPETAALLGVELATMKTRLHRARLRVMGALREELGDGA